MLAPRPHVSREILEFIVEPLSDEPETLKNCCLVAKSWVPRVRFHLFAQINFKLPAHLQAWKKNFPDPATSPGCYARSLIVCCPEVVAAVDAEEGGWIREFTNVVRFQVVWSGTTGECHDQDPLLPFRNFSPALESLSVIPGTLPSLQVFNFVCSFPLLEDLTVLNDGSDGIDEENQDAFQPSTSPVLTGTLELCQGLEYAARRLLDLPNGLHFREIVCELFLEEDIQYAMALVERCSGALEHLNIHQWSVAGDSPAHQIDLSRATKLNEVTLQFAESCAGWTAATLETITPKWRDLEHISIYVPSDPYSDDGELADVEEGAHLQWSDLDRVLVQIWESSAVHTKVRYSEATEGWDATHNLMEDLLPEMTKRGKIQLINSAESDEPWWVLHAKFRVGEME